MNIREMSENNEQLILSKFATKSKDSLGRKIEIEKCEIRTEFQRDRDRIIHSKSFRRLMHKTQVFISPEKDHFRTRLTHTIEVSQIARTIARALRLNEDLTEAISLGHDLGHTPFGHTGEDALDELTIEGFEHNKQSIRVVEKIEKNGKGLNLTSEVLDGILNHQTSGSPKTLEGKIVQISDKIAYINHDIDDAIRANLLNQEDLPKEELNILGQTCSQRINFLIRNIINKSLDKNDIIMDEDIKKSMYNLRSFLYKTVYLSQLQLKERFKIKNIIHEIYFYYIDNFEKLPAEFVDMQSQSEKERIVIDYIACMTDRYALKVYKSLFLPEIIY